MRKFVLAFFFYALNYTIGYVVAKHQDAAILSQAEALRVDAEATLDEAAQLNAEARTLCPTTQESNP